MKTADAVLLSTATFLLGVLVAAVLAVAGHARRDYHTLDVESQLVTCNAAREELHKDLHIVSDSLLLLETRRR